MPIAPPRFRRDLEAVPFEAGGETYVEVRDPATGASFQFYDFEYRVALAFDGLELEQVIPWVRMSTGLDLNVEQLAEFAARLAELGFLEGVAPEPAIPSESPTDDSGAPDDQPAAPRPVSAPEASPEEAADAPPAESSAPVESAAQAADAPPAESSAPVESAAQAADAPPAGNPASTPLPADSPAFPVLPSSRVRPLDREPPGLAEWATASEQPPAEPSAPRLFMTPAPITFGPTLIAEQPSARTRRRTRRSLLLFGSLGVLAAGVVLAIALPFFFPPREPPRLPVRALTVTPNVVYRYFEGAGTVQAIPGRVLKFPTGGKVTHIAVPGSKIATGDIVAAVDSARSLQDKLAKQHERLAYARQMAETMHEVGNRKEEERQAARVDDRNATIEKLLRDLADVAVVADVPGEVDEILARAGETVEAGHAAVRLRSPGFRARFEFPRNQAAQARRLGFCQVEVDGYTFDCAPAAERGERSDASDDSRVDVNVPSLPAHLAGHPARLARSRFDGATVLPLSTILRAGAHAEVLLVSPSLQAEARPVTVAEQGEGQALVTQGLDAGDLVILDPEPRLRPGARVTILP